MKFVIVLACLLALALANEDAKVIRNEAEVNVDSFKYALELDNTVKAEQEGHAEGEENWIVKGEYEYTSPEGKLVKVTYTADDSGYHPVVHN